MVPIFFVSYKKPSCQKKIELEISYRIKYSILKKHHLKRIIFSKLFNLLYSFLGSGFKDFIKQVNRLCIVLTYYSLKENTQEISKQRVYSSHQFRTYYS